MLLLFSYGINIAVLYAISTLLNQIILKHFRVGIFPSKNCKFSLLSIFFFGFYFTNRYLLMLNFQYVYFFLESLKNYKNLRLLLNFSSFQGHEEDAGRIGLTIVCTGMLSSVICGVILDKTHKFK